MTDLELAVFRTGCSFSNDEYDRIRIQSKREEYTIISSLFIRKSLRRVHNYTLGVPNKYFFS